MIRHYTFRRASLAGLVAFALATGACQKNEQSAVQPEKLASSSAKADATSPPASSSAGPSSAGPSGSTPGPLIPYASGKAPSAGDEGGIPSPDGPSDPTAQADPDAQPGGVEAPLAAKGGGTKGELKLVKAGAEPRQELRFAPKVGLSDKLDMTMTMKMGIQVGAQQLPQSPLPPMVMKMKLKVVEVRPNGDIKYDFVLDGTDVMATGADPRVVSAMKSALGGLKGLSGYAVTSSTGMTRETKVVPPKGAGAQIKQVMQGMEQAMNQISAPLPEEPVGKGAQWTFTNTMRQNGVLLSQQATYDLVGIKPGKIKLDVKVVQRAPKQDIKAPNGVMVKLLSLDASGGGKSILRLDHLSPQRSSMMISSKVKMGLPDKKTMLMSTDMSIDMTGK